MKLYPPLLEGTIPAFYFRNTVRVFWNEQKLREEARLITAVIVPYEMNKGVSNADFDSMELKMKMVQSTSNKWQTISSYKVDKENKLAYFDVSEVKTDITRFINVGQFYKVQIAYAKDAVDEYGVATREIGYYSTVATVKYSAKPKVIIHNLDSKDTNSHLYNYIGCYSQSKRDFWIFEQYLNSQEVVDIINEGTKKILTINENYRRSTPTEVRPFSARGFNLVRTVEDQVDNNTENENVEEDKVTEGDAALAKYIEKIKKLIRELEQMQAALDDYTGPREPKAQEQRVRDFERTYGTLEELKEKLRLAKEEGIMINDQTPTNPVDGAGQNALNRFFAARQESQAIKTESDLKLEYLALLKQYDDLIKRLEYIENRIENTSDTMALEHERAMILNRYGTLAEIKEKYSYYKTELEKLGVYIEEDSDIGEKTDQEQQEGDKHNQGVQDAVGETSDSVGEATSGSNNSDNSSSGAGNNNSDSSSSGQGSDNSDSSSSGQGSDNSSGGGDLPSYIENDCDGSSNYLVPYSVPYGGDFAEKVYTYKFDLFDKDRNLIDSSGWQYHDSSTDLEIYESQDSYSFNQDLLKREVYYIQYTVRTINNLVESSPMYRIAQQEVLGPTIDLDIFPKLDFENGRVIISLRGSLDKNGTENITTGKFRIMRTSDESNYLSWEKIADFQLLGQRPSKYQYCDYTTKHGFNYIYSLQQYNDYGVFSDKVKSKELYVDFEHAFLFDGQKQLKIKYNPKVSSFKNTLLESKVDTIGSQFPFITRNGNVNYKEFPISGLISYKMDEEYCFIDREFLKQEVPGTINLIGENIADERNFKMEVLKWLTNGEPKVFRSPAEGNFIIRLLNTSMTPTDTVNRMLHTFTGTAYEIAEYNYENLVKYGFIDDRLRRTDQVLWKTVKMNAAGGAQNQSQAYGGNLLEYQPIIGIKFEGMVPGDRFYVDDGISRGIITTYYEGEKDNPYKTTKATGYVITIGATGEYNIDIKEGVKINEIVYLSSQDNPISADYMVSHQGTITYAYLGWPWTLFDNIKHLQMIYNPVEQFRGPYKQIENSKIFGMDIINSVQDIRTIVQDILYIRFICKEQFKIYENNGQYYSDVRCTPGMKIEINQSDTIYEVISLADGSTLRYIDGFSGDEYDTCCTEISLNGDIMDLLETKEYITNDFASIKGELLVGNGVICEMGYQQVTTSYTFEEEEEFQALLKEVNDIYANRFAKQYDVKLEYMNDEIRYHINKSIAWQSDIEASDGYNLLSKYNNYLSVLEKRIAEEKER